MKTKPQRGDIIDKAFSGMGLMHKVFFYRKSMIYIMEFYQQKPSKYRYA